MQVKVVYKSLGDAREDSINTKIVEKEVALEELVFCFAEEDNGQLFAILDGARSDEVLMRLVQGEAEYESLFKGLKEAELYEVSPFLVVCKKETGLVQWLTSDGWGQSLGIFFTSPDSFENLFNHFQRFLRVKTEDGDEMYFRFYDPRVLRVYLPTCTSQELNLFFDKKISRFILESKDSRSILSFTFSGPEPSHRNGSSSSPYEIE